MGDCEGSASFISGSLATRGPPVVVPSARLITRSACCAAFAALASDP
jgi:hypothetical protein